MSEAHLIDVGYFWLRSLGKPAKAIEVFKLLTTAFPESWNTYDSLTEAYAKNGINEEAIYNYKKSIALNFDETYRGKTRLKIEEI